MALEKTSRYKLIAIIFILLLSGLVPGLTIHRYLSKKSVIENGSVAMATILDKRIERRRGSRPHSTYKVCMVYYTFKTRDNESMSGGAEIDFSDWYKTNIGDKIEVRYDKKNPKFNFLAQQGLQNELIILVCSLAVAIPIFLFVVFALYKEIRAGC